MSKSVVNKYLMYLRKSRGEENETVEEVLARHEIQLQELAIRLFGECIPEENIYREVVSGETIDNRPAMQEVLKKIQTQEYDGVLVIEPQRLSRGDMIDAGTIVRAFQYTFTKIVTPVKTYDLNDKYDRKFFEMELRQGNDYLEYVKEILQRGRLHSVKQGNYVGSIEPYGYKKVKDGKNLILEIVPEEAKIVKIIFDMFVNERVGVSNICNRLNSLGITAKNGGIWRPGRLRDLLRNPIYIGKIRWNARKTVKKYQDGKIVATRPRNVGDDLFLFEGKHDPIIEEEMWNKAQTLFGHPIKLTNNKDLRCIFAGFIHCECGYSMTYRTQGGHGSPRMVCTNQINCGQKSITYEDLKNAVKQILIKELGEYKELIKGNKEQKDGYKKNTVEKLKKEILKLDEQEERLFSFLEDGTYTKPVFVKRKQLLDENRKRLGILLEEAEASFCEIKSYRDGIVKLENAIKSIDNKKLSVKEKNKLLSTVIEDIIYSRKVPQEKRKFRDNEFSVQVKLKI